MKFTTAILKKKIVELFSTDSAVRDTIIDRHGGHFPKGYVTQKYWTREAKVKLNSEDEQEDKLGWSPLDKNASDYTKNVAPIIFPCICRVFQCTADGDWDWDKEDENEAKGIPSEHPDDTNLIMITDAQDENILMYSFTSD
jgi:hypothetical protein